jgi:hypothetical protein
MPFEDLFNDLLRDVSFVEQKGAPTADFIWVQLQFTELEGKVRWESNTLAVEGAVPLVERTLTLRPEKGVAGAVSAVGEIEVDDDVIDAAWVIRGDDAALLVHMQPELRTLAELAPSIDVSHAKVTVQFAKIDARDPNAKRALEGALAIWHRVAFFRM